MTTATTTVTPRRVYAVRDNTSGQKRLVRAINVAAALRHVVRIAYTVDVASQDDLIELLTSGVSVEDASTAEDDAQGQPSRRRRSTQPAEAQPEVERDPRVPDMFDAVPAQEPEAAAAAPEAPAVAPTPAADDLAAPAAAAAAAHIAAEEVAAEQPGELVPVPANTSAAAPATPALTSPTAEATAADAPAKTESAPSPAAASAAAEPQGSTAADDLEARVRALGTRLGTEQPRLPPDVVPLELLELVGVENPRLGDVLPWYGEEMGKVFWDAYYAAALPMAEVQRQAQQAAERQAAVRRTGHPPVRYRHPTSGQTWSGRGLKPKWIQAEIEAGRTLSDFEVKEA